MKRCLTIALLAALQCATVSVHAQEKSASTPVETPRPALRLFAKPAVLRGTLGNDQIQVTLRAKEDMAEGLEGDYFYFGRSQKILLAGEFEQDAIFLEESENGKDVSGQWDGTLHDGRYTGTWSSFDGAQTKPFALTVTDASSNTAARNPSAGAATAPR